MATKKYNPSSSKEHDPYRYGWRYVRHVLPDGRTAFDQVPLTLEDVLHPQEEDFIVHSDQHENIRTYLQNVLKAHLAHDTRARVFSDLRIAWDVPEVKPLGPDIAVVFGVRKRRKWTTFDVAKEGVRPSLVIEITSPETRKLDFENKVVEYALAKIPLYVIVDIQTGRKGDRLELYGYQLTPAGYVRFLADARGWLWLAPVGLWLGVVQGEGDEPGAAYLYGTDGNVIGDYTDITRAYAEAETRAAEAETRAQAEAQARAEAETRLRELEAELQRLRGESERSP